MEKVEDGAGFVAEKRCCTVCDAKKKCHVCRAQSPYACADCQIDLGATVYVCPTKRCRDAHEEKCSARMRDALLELFNMVNHALDARDALLISKTCATMDRVRKILGLSALPASANTE